MPITPVVFSRSSLSNSYSQYYVVGAEYSAGDADDLVTPLGGGFAGGIYDWLRFSSGSPSFGYFGLGMGLPFPGLNWPPPEPEGYYGSPFAEVNFQFNAIQVPEPSMHLLLVPGLACLFLWHRKCR